MLRDALRAPKYIEKNKNKNTKKRISDALLSHHNSIDENGKLIAIVF